MPPCTCGSFGAVERGAASAAAPLRRRKASCTWQVHSSTRRLYKSPPRLPLNVLSRPRQRARQRGRGQPLRRPFPRHHPHRGEQQPCRGHRSRGRGCRCSSRCRRGHCALPAPAAPARQLRLAGGHAPCAAPQQQQHRQPGPGWRVAPCTAAQRQQRQPGLGRQQQRAPRGAPPEAGAARAATAGEAGAADRGAASSGSGTGGGGRV